MRGAAPTFVLASALLGCAGGYRLGASPTLDTNLRAGFVAHASGNVGIATSRRRAAVLVAGVEGGVQANPAAPVLLPIVGAEYFHASDANDLTFRVGARARFLFAFEQDEARKEVGSGIVVAILPSIGRASGSGYKNLGVEVQAQIMAPLDAATDAPLYGLFSVGAVYDVEYLTTLNGMLPGKK